MSDAKRPTWLHPLVGSTLPNWVSVWRKYGGVDRIGLGRAACIWSVAVGGMPIRWYERLRYGGAISRERLDPPPVFIIGHWRSGTTNLHNHMLQDEQFGCVSFLQCLAPGGFLVLGRLLTRLLEKKMPETRPMDQVPAGLAEPMSEDFAMSGLSDLTHHHSYYFPKSAETIFRRTILFEGVSDREIETWGKRYAQMLRKVAFASGGRRLLLKNPANTGRLPHLLRMFPDAKFIFVARNPFPVYASTCKLIENFLNLFSLQRYDFEPVSKHVLERYRELLQKYLRDRELIPRGNLVEIRHEDMVADPMAVLQRIYSELQLPGFEAARPRMERYVESLKGYRTNSYKFDADTTQQIGRMCDFAFDEWGFEPPPRAGQSAPDRDVIHSPA